jgi:hypothetical protein
MLGNFLIAAQLEASQEGLSPMSGHDDDDDNDNDNYYYYYYTIFSM